MTPAINMLDDAAVPYEVHAYERSDSLRDFGIEAATALDLDPDQVFKTLIVTCDLAGKPTEVCAIVPVSSQLNLKAVAQAVGAKKAQMCDPTRAERLSGYVRGGISPFGQKKQLVTVVDETAEIIDRIYVSGGKRGVDISLAPDALIAVLDAVVAPIAA